MNMRVVFPALMLVVAASVAGAVDMTGPTPPDGLQGIIDIPALFGSGPCTQRTGGKIQLRVAPSNSAAPAGMLEADPIAAGQNACSQDLLAPRLRKPGDAWTSPVPTREFKLGHPGLIITDGSTGWVKIMLGDGEAWLPVIPGWGLHDYGTLVSTSPAHTLRGWDGRVCANPRFEDCRTMALPSNPAIRITRTQVVGGELWFKLEFGIGACEGPAQPGRDVLSGWIPGFGSPGASGKRPLTLWMDPQGCPAG